MDRSGGNKCNNNYLCPRQWPGEERIREPTTMGCDLVVALGRATASGKALFGLNCHRLAGERQALVVRPAQEHAAGETLALQNVRIAERKETFATLGCQPEGDWGYLYGVNEHRVAVGHATWQSLLPPAREGLAGTELVRLALERGCHARGAVDVLTDLIGRYGQAGAKSSSAEPDDHIFLIADTDEAFVLETAGNHWALQEITCVRAISDVGLIRQDWSGISRGLADLAIARGWWPSDGSKLDFAGCISADPVGPASALRRWGRATYLVEAQNGAVDRSFLRRLLADHYEDTSFEVGPLDQVQEPVPLCRHVQVPEMLTTSGSFYVELGRQPWVPVTAWCAFGSPCLSVYFPVFLIAPDSFNSLGLEGSPFRSSRIGERWQQLRRHVGRDLDCFHHVQERLSGLQSSFEEETEGFLEETTAAARPTSTEEVQRQATSLMQHCVEQFEGLVRGLAGQTTVGGGRAVVR
jgi:dipeptidase